MSNGLPARHQRWRQGQAEPQPLGSNSPWHVGRSRSEYTPPDLEGGVIIASRQQIGPLIQYHNTWQSREPLGTNAVQVGDILYSPVTKRESFRVLATERWHEFDDGTEREGVLVREFAGGGENWVPREGLGKELVGR